MEETLEGWLAALASPNPTPGGGAAAGLMIATGAALVEMVCGLTTGREKFKDVEELMRRSAAHAATLRAEAEHLRAADEAAYGEVAVAFKLPRGSAEEKSERSKRVQQALRLATDTPLRAVATAVAVIELAASVVEKVNQNAISDAGAGALAARAGAEASALNVRINLTLLQDPLYTEQARAQLTSLLARGDAACTATLAAVHAVIGG